MLDSMIKEKIKENVNMTVPLYLMMSYAYYKQDDPIAEDATFDEVAKILLKNYDKIKHHHKELIRKDSLKAGTYLGVYPTIVKDTVEMVRKKIYMLGKLVKLLITLIIGFYVSIILLIYVGVPILNLIF